jgi:pimeloyl-ACP methyl ester carboxylesterase
MTRLAKSYVDLPDGQVHVLSVDGAAPAIVFLHQTASSGASFAAVMDRLHRVHRLPNRLIALDTPGFGGSFDPPGWPSMKKYAAWITAALDRLKVRRFHLFGHHTGGNLAAEIAWRHPARAASVMILGPVPMTRAERAQFRRAYDQPIAPRADGMHLVENWAYCHKFNPSADLAIVHEEVVNMARAWKARPQAYRAVSFHDAMARVRKLTCPLLFMTSPQDFFYPGFAGVCARYPDAKVAIVGGENLPPQSDPRGMARAVAKFVRGVEGGRRVQERDVRPRAR